MDSTAEYSA